MSKPQRPLFAQLCRLARSSRYRVSKDVEGFPIMPGRYGRIEWFDGRNLAVYCDRPRLFAKIWAIPGVRRHQTGDTEMRAMFPPEALEQIASGDPGQAVGRKWARTAQESACRTRTNGYLGGLESRPELWRIGGHASLRNGRESGQLSVDQPSLSPGSSGDVGQPGALSERRAG